MVKDNKAYAYATYCVNERERKVPVYVKKQAKAWLTIADGNDKEAYVDAKMLKKVCDLLKILRHPDLGCSLYDGLEDYAWFMIVATLCTKNRADGCRYYMTSLLEIARKNFKTFNSAILIIILMLTEPMFSRFFSVAPDLKLSKELQIAIKKIIKTSTMLEDEGAFKLLRSEIRCLITESEYTPLAYSQDKLDGKLAHAWVADECGAMDGYPIEAMRSSQITLHDKLGIVISTQYPNDNNAMIDEIDISKKTLDGLLDSKRRFSLLYEPDQDLKVEDVWQTNDLCIYQSNPVAIAHEYIFDAIKDMRAMAILYENKRENYLCKHNNIKYKGLGVEGYIEISKVKACKKPLNKAFWKGKHVYIGFDLSMTNDNTSVAMVCDVDGVIYTEVWGFIPSERIDIKSKAEQVDYHKLIKDGCCFACGDEVIDYSFVEHFILSLADEYGVVIQQVGYDRYNAISTVQKLENGGLECVEIKQHSSVLHMPTKLLKEKILSKEFAYFDNKMLEINFQNARCTKDTNLNLYVNKKKSTGKVDMVVSLINATYLLQQNGLYGNDNFVVQTM